MLYANHQAHLTVNHPKGPLKSLRILRDGIPSSQSAAKNFQNFLAVYESGETKEYTFFAHHSGLEYEVLRQPFEGGILSTTRDRRAQREAEKKEQEKSLLLNGIVENSPIGIMVYEAIRDEKGEIVDFRIKLYNSVLHQLTNITEEERKHLSFRQLLKSINADKNFHLYEKAVQTGEPFSLDYFSPRINGWLHLSVGKLGDGIFIMLSNITERKQQQLALQQNAAYLDSILNASLNAVVTMEAIRNEAGKIVDMRYRQANKRFLDGLNRSKEEVIGGTMLNLFPATMEAGIFDIYRKVMESGEASQQEVYYKEGEMSIWFDVAVVRLDENSAVGTFYDISLRKKAFEQIEEQKTLLDNILKYSSNGISVGEMIRDENGKIINMKTLLANDAAVKFTGIPKEVYLTKTAKEVDPSFLSSPYYQLCVRCMETGEPFITQYFLEGVGKWLEVSVSKMDAERQIYMFTDVTSIKETQLALQRSAERLSTVINTSQAGFFMGTPVLDESGEITDFRFTLVNEVLAAFVGETPEKLVGQLGSERFVKYKSNGLFQRFREAYLTGEKQQFDFYYRGEYVEAWTNLMVAKVGDELLGTFTDITQIKNLQLQLEEKVEELKRSNTNLEEFAYAASHDLQEPLRKIYTFSEKLKQDLSQQLSSAQRMMFERIENASQRMRDLIDDLLAYSEVGAKEGEMETVSLNQIAEQVTQDLEGVIQETGAVITSDPLPQLTGNKRQLRQLFHNLIGNAIKYRKPNVVPQITIHCEISQRGEKGAFYVITITDNGIGFEQEHAEKIFQVFQRLHGRSEYKGTGVGLAIVQKVVQNHKGHISAEGVPGVGATFKVVLPA